MPALEKLYMYNIGMDLAGAEIIAKALSKNQRIEELTIGWSAEDGAVNQSAALTRILRAMTPVATPAAGSPDDYWYAPNIKTLHLYVYGSRYASMAPELGEALAHMLSSSTSLQTLDIKTSFLSMDWRL